MVYDVPNIDVLLGGQSSLANTAACVRSSYIGCRSRRTGSSKIFVIATWRQALSVAGEMACVEDSTIASHGSQEREFGYLVVNSERRCSDQFEAERPQSNQL